jgi:hypothetical protein
MKDDRKPEKRLAKHVGFSAASDEQFLFSFVPKEIDLHLFADSIPSARQPSLLNSAQT